MILVVMAAGMGSRFGGLKQLTPVGKNGELLIDYSIYDAIKNGVEKVVFVIRKEHLELFRDTIGKRVEKKIKVEYAFQEKNDLPIEIEKIEREKPWGTGQAILSSRNYVDSPFIVINADDYYGQDAFQKLTTYLRENKDNQQYAMVAYQLENTLSKNGTVSRGICEVENDYLKSVTEKTKIGYINGVLINEEDGDIINANELVSCNLFGFTPNIFKDATEYFKIFLQDEDNLKQKEFYLPTIVQKSIEEGKAKVKVLRTTSKFYGMTYREDLEELKNNIQKLIQEGFYPENLWEAMEDESRK